MDEKEVRQLARHITQELTVHLAPMILDNKQINVKLSEDDLLIQINRAIKDWQIRYPEPGTEAPIVYPEVKHVAFYFFGLSETKKTSIWYVTAKESQDNFLGWIRWYAPWRQYCFYPFMPMPKDGSIILAKSCMRDIANFCEYQSDAQRE